MRTLFSSNLFSSNGMTLLLMGVLLLFASAIGRVTATNVGQWLQGTALRTERATVPAPERFAVATVDWSRR
ncbi:MAG TPA: hypothetical protein VF678_07300 [bacterium]